MLHLDILNSNFNENLIRCCTLVSLLLPLHLKNSCTDNSSETAFRASCRQKVYPETFTRAIDAEKAHGLVNELSKVRTAIAVLWQSIY